MIWSDALSALLPVIPVLAVFGNALVVLAVCRERSLHTVTNLLIVSLAISDFMVAMCVMSFGVYVELNEFKWELGQFMCNVYLATDVTCSTASILNLLAISLDRYIAISHPISYAQYGSRGGRAMISISIVWGVSISVGFPILLGVNKMTNEACELGNPYFNILSSLFSFFIPCMAMIVLYAIIFRRLRQRERARSLRQAAKTETDRISNALLGGARFARQMGTHFKHKTDQILLEISFQTSSYPTMTDSSDESTSSPLTPKEAPAPLPSPQSRISLPRDDRESERQSLRHTDPDLDTIHSSLQRVHSQCSSRGILRSFGEDLEELIPYIDCGSRKDSNDDDLHRKRSSRESKRKAKQITPTRSMGSIRRNGSLKMNGGITKCNTATSTTTDMLTVDPRPKVHLPIEKLSNNTIAETATTMTENNGLVNNARESSFGESLKTYKTELWKRVTSGWKARPSRHLIKKATKQMKREQKATVTLAVVLAVFLFCWLPFFILHAVNSLCAIQNGDGCIPVMAMFLATWLGYINSSLNPLIYTVFDQRFRNAFRSILFCGAKKKR